MSSAFFNIPVHLSPPSVAGNSQYPFIFSDDVVLIMPAIKLFQDVFHHDKFTVNQPADGNTLHFVEAAEGIVEAAEGIVEATEGIAEAREVIAEASERIVETAEGTAEAAEGIVKATKGIVEAAEGTVEATEGIVEATKGNVKATEYTILKNNSTNILSRFVKHSINN